MAKIRYSERALLDIERLTDFLHDMPDAALQTANLIMEAVDVLENHPFIGRKVKEPFRELVISRGKSGYLALYSYDVQWDTVLILSIRHQREAGYPLNLN